MDADHSQEQGAAGKREKRAPHAQEPNSSATSGLAAAALATTIAANVRFKIPDQLLNTAGEPETAWIPADAEWPDGSAPSKLVEHPRNDAKHGEHEQPSAKYSDDYRQQQPKHAGPSVK